MTTSLRSGLWTVFVAALVLGCDRRSASVADTRAADEAAIRQADIAAAKTGETNTLHSN